MVANLTVVEFLEVLLPPLLRNEHIELRMIRHGDVNPLFIKSPDQALNVLEAYPKSNAFAGIGTRNGRGGDRAHTGRLQSVWADGDDKHYANGHSGVLEAINGFAFPPSILLDTGGGMLPYWLLDAPVGSAEFPRVEAINEKLRYALAPDGKVLDDVSDVAHVGRLPGTLNFKYSPPHRVQVLTWEPNRRYSLAELEQALSMVKLVKRAPDYQKFAGGKAVHEGDGRKTALVSFAGLLRSQGFDPDTIMAQVAALNAQACKPPLLDPELKDIARSVGKWPAGEPRRALSGLPELAAEAYQGPVGQIVRTLAPHTEAHPAGLLLVMLAYVGNYVGPGAYFLVGSRRHPGRTNPLLVGRTGGGRKGMATAESTWVFREIDIEYGEYNIKGGIRTGQALVHEVRDAAKNDPGVTDKRLVLIEEEFATVLRLMGDRQSILSQQYRLAFDTGNLWNLTKIAPERATNAHVTLIGTITKEELLRNITDTELANGFANRLLFCCVERQHLLPDGGHPPYKTLKPHIDELRANLKKARAFGQMARDGETNAIWHAIYGPLSEGGSGLLGAVTGRAEVQVLRLSIEYATQDGSEVIRAEHLLAALAMWEYCEASAVSIFGDRTGNRVADRILAAARREGKMTGDDIYTGLFHGHVRKEVIDRALAELLRLGLVIQTKETTEGRPITWWEATTEGAG